MVYESLLNVQSAFAGGSPINLKNGILLEKFDEFEDNTISDQLTDDDRYEIIFKDGNLTILTLSEDNLFKYIIKGHVNERDELGRRIAFNSYFTTDENVLDAIDKLQFLLYNYNYTLNNNLKSSIIQKLELNTISLLKKDKLLKKSKSHIILLSIMSIILYLAFFFELFKLKVDSF